MIFISLFDEVRVTIDGRLAALRRKEAALVAFLALRAGVPTARELLATLLWGERDEGAARHSLRQALLALRRELGEALKETTVGLTLDQGAFQCDLGDAELPRERIDGAEVIPPLPSRVLNGLDAVGTEPFADWVATRRAAYRARWRDAVTRVRDDSAEAARWSDAERASRALEEDQPLDTESVRQLVRTLRRAGAPGEAAASLAAAQLRFEQSGVDTTPLVELARTLPGDARSAQRPGGRRGGVAHGDLVGRERELAELAATWRSVAGGAAHGVLVTGIDGSGRSRLAEDFARALPASERRLLWIGHTDTSTAEPAAHRVARALLDARGAAAAEPDVVSRVRDCLGSGASPAVPDVLALLRAVAAERPVLMVLDDADLWGEADAALRHALMAPCPRAMTIATCWTEFAAPRGTRRLELGGLSVAAVTQLIAARTTRPEPACARAAQALEAATAGHPQWILDACDTLRPSEGVRAVGTALDLLEAPSPLPISATLRDELRRRLDALPVDARRLLDLIADSPTRASAAELARHLALSPDALTAALDPLLRARFVRAGSHPAAPYGVAHPLIERVVRDALHPARLLPEPRRAGRWSTRRRWAMGAVAAAALAATAFAARSAWSRWDTSGPRLIVLHELFTADSADRATLPVDEMLATNLARIASVEILPGARLPSTATATSRALLDRAEFDLGGAMARRGGGVRLDLRLTSRRDGRVRGGISVEAPDLFAAVDQATAEVALLLAQPIPPSPLSRVSTASLPAFRLFEEGESARATGNRERAAWLLREAIRVDTSFALARLHLAQALGDYDKDGAHAQLDTALSATARLPERERLLVRAWRAMIDEDPVRELLADSLVAKWPLDANGYLIQGQARTWRGAFLPAVTSLRRAIALDAPGLSGIEASCLACDAYEGLISALLLADSLDAAMQVAREWERLQPQGGRASAAVSSVAQTADDLAVAAAAARRAVALNPADEYAGVYEAVWQLRRGAPGAALRTLEPELRHPSAGRRRQAIWFSAIAERNAGRPADAEARLRRFFDALPAAQRPAYATFHLQRAQAFLEAGDARRAALLFDSISVSAGSVSSSHRMGRLRAWAGTLAADAWVAAGDTNDLARRIREVEAWGAQSAYGRDRVLHHHLRGLQYLSRGDLPAARRELLLARWSPTGSYARTTNALIDVLLRERRPADALQLLRQASRGSLESVHLYGTRRDVHQLYARAWRAVGRPDSAAAHERWLAAASR